MKANGWAASVLRRGGDCGIFGHVPSSTRYDFKTGKFEAVPDGDFYCCWCKQHERAEQHTEAGFVRRMIEWARGLV